ncbi:hypothetical protein Droror1_Dr00008864 [Drosera rotundifolia]
MYYSRRFEEEAGRAYDESMHITEANEHYTEGLRTLTNKLFRCFSSGLGLEEHELMEARSSEDMVYLSNSVLFIGLVFGFVELVRGPIYEDCYSCTIVIAVLSLFIATLLAWVILNNQARRETNLRSAPEHLLRIFLLGILFPVISSVLPPMKLKPVLMLGMWIIYLFIAVAAYRKKKIIQLLTNYLCGTSSTTEEQHIKHHSDGSRFGLGHMVDLNRYSTSLVSSSPMGKNMVLNYIPPNVIDDEEIASPSQANIEAANPKWKDCVFGYFIGEQPSFRKIKKAAKKYWGPMGLTEVMSYESGFLFFHIPDAAARLRIIEQVLDLTCKINTGLDSQFLCEIGGCVRHIRKQQGKQQRA